MEKPVFTIRNSDKPQEFDNTANTSKAMTRETSIASIKSPR